MNGTHDANAEPQAVRSGIERQQMRIGFSFFTFILIGMMDGAVGILIPSIGAHYGIDKATTSRLFPTGAAGYLIAALSSGLLLERLGRRAFLALGGVVLAVAALVISFQPPFVLLFIPWLCVGFGLAILDAGLNAYIAGLPQSTKLLNFLHAFYGAGALLGPVIASAILAAAWRWGTTYLVWAIIATAVVVGFSLLFEPRIPAAHDDGGAGGAGGAGGEGGAKGSNVLANALRLPVAWIAAIFLLVYVGAEVSLGSWTYSLLTEERHILDQPAAWMVSGYWLGLGAGRIVLGRFSDRLSSRRLIELSLVGVLVGVVLVWASPIGALTAFGLFFTGFSLGPIFPTTIAVLAELVPERLQQSAIGLAASLGSMGAAAFPFVAGNLAQGLGLWSVLPFALVLTLIMVAIWALLMRTARATAATAAAATAK